MRQSHLGGLLRRTRSAPVAKHHPRTPRMEGRHRMNRPAQEPDSRRHDQTSKLLFSHPPAATDLVRDFAANGWVHGLDLRAVEAFPTESVSADLKRRLGDCAWRVWFKDRRASVVFLVEFQSSVDHEMVFRTMDYSHGAHLVFHRNPGMLDPGGAMPHIVSVVVYSGGQPWSAVPTLAQLARRRTPSLPEVARGLGGEWQHSHGHRVLDLQAAFAQDLLPEDSLLAWLAAMEKAPWTSLPSVRRSLVSSDNQGETVATTKMRLPEAAVI